MLRGVVVLCGLRWDLTRIPHVCQAAHIQASLCKGVLYIQGRGYNRASWYEGLKANPNKVLGPHEPNHIIMEQHLIYWFWAQTGLNPPWQQTFSHQHNSHIDVLLPYFGPFHTVNCNIPRLGELYILSTHTVNYEVFTQNSSLFYEHIWETPWRSYFQHGFLGEYTVNTDTDTSAHVLPPARMKV